MKPSSAIVRRIPLVHRSAVPRRRTPIRPLSGAKLPLSNAANTGSCVTATVLHSLRQTWCRCPSLTEMTSCCQPERAAAIRAWQGYCLCGSDSSWCHPCPVRRESSCSTAGVIICGRVDGAVGVHIDPYCQRRGTSERVCDGLDRRKGGLLGWGQGVVGVRRNGHRRVRRP
jgi:hypothetical protein